MKPLLHMFRFSIGNSFLEGISSPFTQIVFPTLRLAYGDFVERGSFEASQKLFDLKGNFSDFKQILVSSCCGLRLTIYKNELLQSAPNNVLVEELLFRLKILRFYVC